MSRLADILVPAVIAGIITAIVTYHVMTTSPADDQASQTSRLTETSAGEPALELAPVRVVAPPQDDPAFGDALRAWLLANPGILYEMAAKLDEERAAAAVANDRALIKTHHDALFADPRDGRIGGDPAGGGNGDPDGGPAAPVFVEFVDYNCGFCKRNHAEVKAFAAAHPDATIIIKEFPILGPGSEAAARAVLAVKSLHGMRAYRAVHNAFLEMGRSIEEAGVHALLDELALDDGWDVEKVRAGMHSDTVTAHIEDVRRLAEALRITGTPGFVFRTSIGRGLMTLAQLEASAIPDREGATK